MQDRGLVLRTKRISSVPAIYVTVLHDMIFCFIQVHKVDALHWPWTYCMELLHL